MTEFELQSLPSPLREFAATLNVGERCNIHQPEYEPMMRVVTGVAVVGKRGERWLRWYWQPEALTPDGRFDCGYSGINLGPIHAPLAEVQA